MTNEEWLRVKEEFEQARDAPSEYRGRVLAALESDEVRRELEELFRAYDATQDYLERPAILHQVMFAKRAASGERLGSYLLVRQIGEGGMGVVYEAVRADGEFEQRTAIKLVKLWLKTERETARFRVERQILARLDHPNIARLLDGGTTSDGVPYLVMEFVDGVRIDDYCRENDLDVCARLRLFRQVCEAVEYAHAQGIVHRDLKPANILVIPGGRPKLLDFGIATVVDPAITQTATLSRPATPQYASPEQLRGEPTTPSSDIYSLGVLLYELLTGQSPYMSKAASVEAISRAVYHDEPTAPSKVTGNKEWRHRLDSIVATAMRKDPELRYRGVQDLIADVDRYLEGRKIAGGRFALRSWQRRPVLWALVLLVVSGVGAWLFGAWLFKEGPAVFNTRPSFQRLYAEGLERQQQFDLPTARSLFRRAVEIEPGNALGHSAYSAVLYALGYESLARREATLARNLSAGLKQADQLLILGRYQEYNRDLKSATETYKKLWDSDRTNQDAGLRLAGVQVGAGASADALKTLAGISKVRAGSAEEARVRLQRARADALQSNYPLQLDEAKKAAQIADRIGVRELKADALQVEGDALRQMNRFDEALKAYGEAEALSREDGDLYKVASVENRIGGMYFNNGDYLALETHSNTALALFRQIDNKTAQASILNNLSLAAKSHGDTDGALKLIGQAIEISREAQDLDLEAGELTNLGAMLRRLGRQGEAQKAFEESLACAEKLNNREQIARSHITLEMLARDDGDLKTALDHVNTAISLLAESKSVSLKALALQHQGDDIHASGDLERAWESLEQSLALARQANSKQLVADNAYMLADVAREQRAFRAGEQFLKEADAYYVAQGQKVNLSDASITEARLRIAQGRAARTEKQIQQAIAVFHAAKEDARECGADAALIESYVAQARLNEAVRAAENSRALCSGTREFDARMLYAVRSVQAKAIAGDVDAARRQLQSLMRDLRAKGWGQLVSEVQAALKERPFSTSTP